MTCRVNGCDTRIHGRGLCHAHYTRGYRRGTFNPDVLALTTGAPEDPTWDQCQVCGGQTWGGGKWCWDHCHSELDAYREAKDQAYRNTKRRQALAQNRDDDHRNWVAS